MQKILLYLFPVFLCSCHGVDPSEKNNFDSVVAQVTPAPFYIIKDGTCSVYIDYDKNSSHYKILDDFTFNNEDQINESLEYMKTKLGVTIQKHPLLGLPSAWIPIISYKGKYYSFIRHDYQLLGKKMITDSLLYNFDMVGPQPDPMESISKIGPNDYRILTSKKVLPREITIHIIDEKNQIAIWKTTNLNDNSVEYMLYISWKKVRNLDVIADDGALKCFGFQPDSIDYEKLDK